MSSSNGTCNCPFEKEGHKVSDGNCCFEETNKIARAMYHAESWQYIPNHSRNFSCRNGDKYYKIKAGYVAVRRNKKALGYCLDFGGESTLLELNYIDMIAHGKVYKSYFSYAAAIHEGSNYGYLDSDNVNILPQPPQQTKPAIYNGRKSRFCVWCDYNRFNDGGFFDLETHSLATLRNRSRKNFITFEWLDIVGWFGSLDSFNEYYGSSDENRQLAVEMCKGFYNEKYNK